MNMKDAYQLAKKVDPEDAAVKIVQSQSEEERKFWIYVHDMNLGRQLNKVDDYMDADG